MTRRYLLIVLFLSISFVTACKTSKEAPAVATTSPTPSPAPTEDPRTRVAAEEGRSQSLDYSADLTFDKSRPAVREAARQFVATELPKWTLKGMASQSYESNVFWVDVDLENGKQKRVLSLIVKQFFPESGAPYWKAFPVDRSHASQLHYAHDAELKGKLSLLQDQLDEAADDLWKCQNPRREE